MNHLVGGRSVRSISEVDHLIIISLELEDRAERLARLRSKACVIRRACVRSTVRRVCVVRRAWHLSIYSLLTNLLTQ